MQNEFDDPGLREAIRRAMPRESAPSRLRQSVVAAMSAASAPASPTSQPARHRLRMPTLTPGLAAAAVVALIAVGFAVYQLYDFFEGSRSYAPALVANLPPSMSSSMVLVHDAFAKSGQPPVTPSSLATIQSSLSKQAGVNAFAGSLGAGWQFKGADVTSVDGHKAAEVMFVGNGQAASVFSMAASSGMCGDQRTCQNVNHHAIASVVRGSTMYAVELSSIGGAEPTTGEAETLLGAVSSAVAPATTIPTSSTSH